MADLKYFKIIMADFDKTINSFLILFEKVKCYQKLASYNINMFISCFEDLSSKTSKFSQLVQFILGIL